MTEKENHDQTSGGWPLIEDNPPGPSSLRGLMRIAEFMKRFARGESIMLGGNEIHLPPGYFMVRSPKHDKGRRGGV